MRIATAWLAPLLVAWIGLAGCDSPPPAQEKAATPAKTKPKAAPAIQGLLPPGKRTPPADAPRNPSGIAWKVLKPGTGKAHPTPSHKVAFHVTGWKGDGRLMADTRASGRPVVGPLGRQFRAWVEVLQLMVVGERRMVWVPVEVFDYGQPANPGSLLVFDIELLRIDELNNPHGLSPQQAQLVEAFNRFYASTHIASRNITWLGVEIQQNPCDCWMMQQIIDELKPDLIIETGTYTGGSAYYFASLLEMMGSEQGKVVTVDVRPMVAEVSKRPVFAKRVEVITGDSVSDEVIAKVAERVAKAKTVLVTLDSLHTAEHVARELERYSPFVTPGSYIVVQDTHVRDFFPGSSQSEPIEAVEAFVKTHPEFVQDTDRERLLLSAYRGGFLKRVK